MLTKEIHSLQHPIVKQFVKLRATKKFRYETKLIAISGKKIIEELGQVDTLLLKKGARIHCKANNVYLVDEPILKKMSGLLQPEPYAALVSMPPLISLKGKQRVLALNGIADPGNLGTLLRTALALGWEGVFITAQSVDPFNDKALRAAKGATFRIPLCLGTEKELCKLIQEENWSPWVADVHAEPIANHQITSPCCLILGNESHGPSPLFTYPKISIPIKGIESLNVAAAGAILLYEFAKGSWRGG